MDTMNEGIMRNACNLFLLKDESEQRTLLDENFGSQLISVGQNQAANMVKYDLSSLNVPYYDHPNTKYTSELVVVQSADLKVNYEVFQLGRTV